MFIKNPFTETVNAPRVNFSSPLGLLAATWSTGYHTGDTMELGSRDTSQTGQWECTYIRDPLSHRSSICHVGWVWNVKTRGGDKGSTPLGMTTIDLWMEDACHYNGVAHSSVQLLLSFNNLSQQPTVRDPN